MKIAKLFESFYALLTEANVYNIKEKYNKLSIESFLNEYANLLTTPEAQTMFVKKLTKLLLNEPKYLYAVHELPDNAPAWAKEALSKNELVYFQPDDQLRDNISNLMHYVACLEDDAKSTNNNIAVPAKRDLQGFPKAENIAILLQAQRNYFAKGARNANRTTEGATVALELPSGYIWYKLVEQKAFAREGNTLGICVGRIYTADSCARTGMSIYVLKDPQGNSAVCMSTMKHDTECQEVKGKQNKPPVRKYMPAVQAFMNFKKFKSLSTTAEHDIKNAGYYYSQGKLYTREQALDEWVETKKITTLKNGDTVHEISCGSSTLAAELFGIYSGYGAPLVDTIYDVRSKDNISIFSLFAKNKNITQVKKDDVEENKLHELNQQILEAVTYLLANDYVVQLDHELANDFVWTRQLIWNTQTKQFDKREADATLNLHSVVFSVYNHRKGKQMTASMTSYGRQPLIDGTSLKQLYVHTTPTGECVIISIDQYNKEPKFLLRHANGSFNVLRAISPPHSSNLKMAITEIVNKEECTLTRAQQCMLTTYKEQDKYVNPHVEFKKANSSNADAKVFDFSNLKTDTAKGIAAIAGTDAARTFTESTWCSFDIPNFSLITYVSYRDKDGENLKNWPKSVYGENVPTAIYYLPISYGVEKTEHCLLLVSKKLILAVSKNLLEHRFQTHDDFEKVRDQLNLFAKEQGFTFAEKACKVQWRKVQLTVSRGMVETERTIAHNRLEKRRGRESAETKLNEVKFADGAKFVSMPTAEFAQWSRLDSKNLSLAGLPWKLVKDNKTLCIIVVNKNKKITMFSHNHTRWGWDKEIPDNTNPKEKSLDFRFIPYVKAIATEMGWTGSSQFDIKLDMRSQNWLQKLKALPANSSRYDFFRAVGVNIGRIHNEIIGDYDYDYLVRAGFIKQDLKQYANQPTIPQNDDEAAMKKARKEREKTIIVNITDKGLKALKGGDFLTLETETKPLEGFVKPTVAAPAAPAEQPAEPRVRAAPAEGGESKSGMALARFREMTQANNGTMPGRSDFMRILQAAPFNMSAAGAQTYYYNTKTKYLQQRGQVNERMSFSQFLKVLGD